MKQLGRSWVILRDKKWCSSSSEETSKHFAIFFVTCEVNLGVTMIVRSSTWVVSALISSRLLILNYKFGSYFDWVSPKQKRAICRAFFHCLGDCWRPYRERRHSHTQSGWLWSTKLGGYSIKRLSSKEPLRNTVLKSNCRPTHFREASKVSMIQRLSIRRVGAKNSS